MRCSVLYIDHTAMGGNNGTAQGQPKTQPAAAIAAGFAKGIKHIKQLAPAFFRDAGAIIRYADADKFTLRRGEKLDAGMVGGRKKVISNFCRNGMASVMPFPLSSVHSAG